MSLPVWLSANVWNTGMRQWPKWGAALESGIASRLTIKRHGAGVADLKGWEYEHQMV
jgi:hypothetical protein